MFGVRRFHKDGVSYGDYKMTTNPEEYLAIVGSYTVHPDDAQAFKDIAADSVKATVEKDGCMYYKFGEDVLEPGVIHMSEGWRDRAAFDKHVASHDFAKTLELASALRITDREVHTSIARGRVPL